MSDAAQRVDPAAYEPHEGDQVEVTVRGIMARDEGGQWAMQYADLDTFGRMRTYVFRSALSEGRVMLVHRPPALPPEPPDGAVCRGEKPWHLWHRYDAGNPTCNGSSWWSDSDPHSYEQAIKYGMDPTRRLVELPGPGDRRAVAVLSHAAMKYLDDDAVLRLDNVAAVIRALSEPGAPDAD